MEALHPFESVAVMVYVPAGYAAATGAPLISNVNVDVYAGGYDTPPVPTGLMAVVPLWQVKGLNNPFTTIGGATSIGPASL